MVVTLIHQVVEVAALTHQVAVATLSRQAEVVPHPELLEDQDQQLKLLKL